MQKLIYPTRLASEFYMHAYSDIGNTDPTDRSLTDRAARNMQIAVAHTVLSTNPDG